MLILFDIDATLISTGGMGIRAMGDAGRALVGDGFTTERTEFAGRLDPLIIADLLRHNGLEPTPERMAAMRQGYREHLARRLRTEHDRCRALPGVLTLLDELERRQEPVLGLLTGNYADTGSMKLRACGIDPGRFRLAVWGDESPHEPPSRNHLPGVGKERYSTLVGRAAERVVVIGDTPHDVACARAHGCRAIGVATGSFSIERLREAGADRVFKDLSATEEVLEALVGAW